MKTKARGLLLRVVIIVLCMSTQVMSQEVHPVRLSQSVGIGTDVSAEEQKQLLDRSPLDENSPMVRLGSRKESDGAQEGLAIYPLHFRSFRIYDAYSDLAQDDDEDGFYHRLRVNFDADVEYGDAYVYAKLFLSFEGGPWNHYFTTDVFHILEEAAYDDYVVVTRLIDDYPSGYYDVLIELYDADSDEHVTSYGPYEDEDLSALPLEDQASDYAYHSSESHGGGGGVGLLTLCLIAVGRLFVGSNRVCKK